MTFERGCMDTKRVKHGNKIDDKINQTTNYEKNHEEEQEEGTEGGGARRQTDRSEDGS